MTTEKQTFAVGDRVEQMCIKCGEERGHIVASLSKNLACLAATQVLEAAACGRPLIAADVPGCREAVRAGETGLLVPPHDIDCNRSCGTGKNLLS